VANRHHEHSGQNVSVKHNNNECKTYNMTAKLYVSTLTESSSGPHDTEPYKEMYCALLDTQRSQYL